MRKNIKSLIIVGTFASVITVGYYSGGIINVLGQNNVTNIVKSNYEPSETSEIYINEQQTPTPAPAVQETPTPVPSALPVKETEIKQPIVESPVPVQSENNPGTTESNTNVPVKNNEIEKSRVVLLGDSMTEGLSIYGFFPETHIVGVNSLNTISALEQVDNVASFNPAKLFILLGINDIWEGGSVDDYIGQYKKLITEIKGKTNNFSIYIESILPVSQYAMERNSQISNEIINGANLKLYKMAKELNLNYIDVNSGLKDKEGNLGSEYSNDGVHLINTYYPLWTDKLASYMN